MHRLNAERRKREKRDGRQRRGRLTEYGGGSGREERMERRLKEEGRRAVAGR